MFSGVWHTALFLVAVFSICHFPGTRKDSGPQPDAMLCLHKPNSAHALAYSNFLASPSAKASQISEQSFSFIQGQIAASMLLSLLQTLLISPWRSEVGPVEDTLDWEATRPAGGYTRLGGLRNQGPDACSTRIGTLACLSSIKWIDDL